MWRESITLCGVAIGVPFSLVISSDWQHTHCLSRNSIEPATTTVALTWTTDYTASNGRKLRTHTHTPRCVEIVKPTSNHSLKQVFVGQFQRTTVCVCGNSTRMNNFPKTFSPFSLVINFCCLKQIIRVRFKKVFGKLSLSCKNREEKVTMYGNNDNGGKMDFRIGEYRIGKADYGKVVSVALSGPLGPVIIEFESNHAWAQHRTFASWKSINRTLIERQRGGSKSNCNHYCGRTTIRTPGKKTMQESVHACTRQEQ